nr:hypothetical protein [Tanacetum cinerariifolium]
MVARVVPVVIVIPGLTSDSDSAAPLSSDCVPSPEEPEQAPPLLVYLPYVPKLMYPEYMPTEDDVFPAEEQPLPVAATPTADSPGYILEFDPNRDLEEDDEEDPEEDPVSYPADSTIVALLAVDHVPSEEVTKPLPQIPSLPLPIPSPPPDSPTHIEIPESCLPLHKRPRFASPTPSQEIRESSTDGAARHDEPAIARDDPYSLVREELYGFFDRVDVALGRPMSKDLGYVITDTWDELVGASEEIVPTSLQGLENAVLTISQEYLFEFTSEYGIPESLHPELPGLADPIVEFTEGKVGVYTKFFEFANFHMNLFSLISAPNPAKVKTGTCPRAAQEVPLLTATANRVIDMEDMTGASGSSGTPSTVEKLQLDFSNEDPPLLITERIRTKEQRQNELSQGISLIGNPPYTEVVPEPDLEKEMIAIGAPVNKRRRKRAPDKAEANAPPKVLRKDE